MQISKRWVRHLVGFVSIAIVGYVAIASALNGQLTRQPDWSVSLRAASDMVVTDARLLIKVTLAKRTGDRQNLCD
ncbi:MAG: hypothetical protein AB4290_21485 [Spirulina sp.]